MTPTTVLKSILALSISATLAHADIKLQGAGATFPAPLYFRMTAEYQKLHPDVKIDYQSIGSGGGVKAITDGTVDFAASDAPLNKKELEACGAENIVQVPSCAGADVPAYNVPGLKAELKFTGELLADIFMGKVTKWNDPRLVALNPDAGLPDLAITPAWRTDGSGTTYIWTNYLATQSQSFKETIGTGKSVKWPVGQGGKGNEGVSAVLQATTGSLGYVEENYADENKIMYGSIRNKAGKFVKATPDSVAKAVAAAASQLKGSVLAANTLDPEGETSYPVASMTYLIVYKDLKNVKTREQAQEVVNFLWWVTHDGQKFAPKLNYAPLAPEVQKKVEEALGGITFQGKSVKTLSVQPK
jgi:phosphate transport system substrate-binding protein